MAPQVTIRLPIPPSVNEAYGNNGTGRGRGRYLTPKCKAWIRQADNEYLIQRMRGPLVSGRAKVTIRLPQYMRGDVSNRIKVVEDWMVDRGLTADDSTHVSVTAVRDPTLGRVDYCEVDVSEALP